MLSISTVISPNLKNNNSKYFVDFFNNEIKTIIEKQKADRTNNVLNVNLIFNCSVLKNKLLYTTIK